MVTTIEAALDFGYSFKDIRQWRIGNRMCTVILVPGTKEQYDSYLSSFSKEFKAEDRDKRCQISDGKGHCIRCPEENKCKDCPLYHALDKKGFGTLTFSDLAWTNEDGIEEAFEPVSPEGYNSIICVSFNKPYLISTEKTLIHYGIFMSSEYQLHSNPIVCFHK